MEMQKTPMWYRILELILGILAIALAVWMIASPFIVTLFSIVLLFGFGLLFLGIQSLMRGIFTRELPGWSRALNIIAGILAIILAAVPFTEPIFGLVMVLWFMSFGLLFYGLSMLMLGFAADVPGWYRALLIIFGFIMMIIAFQVIWYPLWGLLFLTIMLPIGLILGGFQLIISAAIGTRMGQAS
ncbi:MAG: DUF308 domain-containing protein [Promethearchaeota archaeon]